MSRLWSAPTSKDGSGRPDCSHAPEQERYEWAAARMFGAVQACLRSPRLVL